MAAVATSTDMTRALFGSDDTVPLAVGHNVITKPAVWSGELIIENAKTSLDITETADSLEFDIPLPGPTGNVILGPIHISVRPKD